MEKALNLFTELHHHDLNEKSGIYQLMIEDHLYVGSSVNLYYRLKHHCSDLRKLKHQNRFVQNCYDKYGKDNVFYRIIEFCEKDVLKMREKYWIDFLNPDTNAERDPVDRIFKQESIDQIIATLKHGYATGRIKSMSEKPINQYTVYGKYLRSYKSAVAAGKALGLSGSRIAIAASRCKWGASSFGYKWKYKEDEEDITDLVLIRKPPLSKFCYFRLTTENGEVVELTKVWELRNYLIDMVNKDQQKLVVELVTLK